MIRVGEKGGENVKLKVVEGMPTRNGRREAAAGEGKTQSTEVKANGDCSGEK